MTEGQTSDTTCGASGTATVLGCARAIAQAAQASTPAGTNTIGKVGFDQSTPGVSNGVSQVASGNTTVTLQNAAAANGNGLTLNINGMSSAVLTVNCATCSGGTTINFEVSEDGTNYSPINALPLAGGSPSPTTTASGITLWQVPTAGMALLRARISSYSAGTVTVTGHAMPVNFDYNSVAIIGGPNYGNQANWKYGTSTPTSSATTVTVITAPSANKLYVQSAQCFNPGAATSTATFNDGASTPISNVSPTGVVVRFDPPLIVAAATALTATFGTASAGQWCNAQAYNAP